MLIDKFALIGFKEALAGIIFYIDINAEARFVLACTRLCGNAVVIGVIYLLLMLRVAVSAHYKQLLTEFIVDRLTQHREALQNAFVKISLGILEFNDRRSEVLRQRMLAVHKHQRPVKRNTAVVFQFINRYRRKVPCAVSVELKLSVCNK